MNHPQSSNITVERLQSYLREVVARERDVIAAPPFTLFLNPTDAREWFNYAIPDRPTSGDLRRELRALRAAFAARQRRPRLEFIEQFAPGLAAVLHHTGFEEQARMQLMICTPQTYTPAPAQPELQVITIEPTSPLEQVRENLEVNSRGFDPEAAGATLAEAEEFRNTLGSARAFSALLNGQPVGAGMYTAPIGGIAELVGIATLAGFRRRGVAAALTARAVASAFASGVEVACLSAADERAGRVYERVGFRPFATMLAYVDQAAG
jgi:ribosomal protein S18 acetylase RimI-like enzyme